MTTEGKLETAKICELDKKGSPKSGGICVECMFNPFEYTVTKTNEFEEKPRNKGDIPWRDFKKAGAQNLKLSLTFDTYEKGQDVSQITNQLWKLMESSTQQESNENKKVPPPNVAFEWGVFQFKAVITTMTQKFTMFTYQGTPVRAKVDVTFIQQADPNDIPGQNPTSGGGPLETVWQLVAGDRLDLIAEEVYGDTAKWRLIAERNNLTNPLALRPGQKIIIPQD